MNLYKKTNLLFSNYSIGEEGDDGDQDNETKTFTEDEVKSMIASELAKSSSDKEKNLAAKNQELLNDLKKMKAANKEFEGIDVDKVKAMYAAMENDQDLKDIAEGKHEDVIKRRMERERAKFNSDLDTYKTENDTLKTSVESLTSKVTDLMINNSVVSEFVKEKGLESAIPDVVLRAKAVFKVEGDETIARDAAGEIISGSNGPITINEWVTALKADAPHLFPGSYGSGTGNSDQTNLSGIEAKIQAALKANDQQEYRRLRKLQKEGTK